MHALFETPRFYARALTQPDLPSLQALFEANPDYFVAVGGVTQPAPAPRYSRTQASIARGAPRRGEGAAQALADWGFGKDEIEGFRARGALLLED